LNWNLVNEPLEDALEEGMPPLRLVYMDPPFMTQKSHGAFDDRWSSRAEFVDTIMSWVGCCWEVLEPGGNLILHLDPRSAPWFRVRMEQDHADAVWHNDVIWSYNSGGAGQRELARKHDVLMWWSKGPEWTFNVLREPYATPNVEGRKGFHPDGRMMTDVWAISILSTTSRERVHYPTQKPLTLLDRVVRTWSNTGDWVLDPCCGSGTTGVAAMRTGRKAFLVDQSLEACRVTATRMNFEESLRLAIDSEEVPCPPPS